ncbi:hypothetical protein Oweho_1591 [Owenweeksia hongkongensis DSM 17368]|uniref:DUF3899 domain-containing protein n=1 Tax=Owenweeksia hongkongensis (strain DSM 17368 / CIP 108786 / JCM 12287 / NRRL B-23963 / UST20020801) TaxID=926562 RepID=G8QZF3_OWEHD|nr:hypothetical protein [Owenweeksia hongkongensis]AEV32581.1 hypothetical protein Oweho_1591 [Owenweeksia hongkongensis DSM 17368]
MKNISGLWKCLLVVLVLWWIVVFTFADKFSSVVEGVGMAFTIVLIFAYALYRYELSKMIKAKGDTFFNQYLGLGSMNGIELVTTSIFREIGSDKLKGEERKMLLGYRNSLYLFFANVIFMILYVLLR